MFSTTRVSLILFLAAMLGMAAQAQQKTDAGRGINWPSSCVAGQAYSPYGNTCVTPGAVSNPIGAVYQVNYFTGSNLATRLQNCVNGLSSIYGGVCDARQEATATLTGAITVSTPNTMIILPCATITTPNQFIVTAGTRNVVVQGCSYQGGSTASGTQGGTVWIYTGSGNAFQIGDLTYAANTPGFWMSNVNLNTASAGSSATGIYFARAQEVRLDSIYLNGNGGTGQTAITLDGTGNYTGGTFIDVYANNFNTGWLLTGHLSGSVSGDFANASVFVKPHVVCPTSGGSPISGSYGINAVAADGNTWDGGDVEGCDTMFHLGANAINNTVDGLRNENSNKQYVADSGSSYNAVFTGGTFFTGQLVDHGSRNSFWDAFHRTANGMMGDWYASQQDATVVNHLRLGIGLGNIRGLQWESQIDQGTSGSIYNWLWGMSDGAGNGTSWFFQDLINGVHRLTLTQDNTNNQSSLNATGTANVCFNCSANSGTGGVNVSSGGSSPSTVAAIDGSGNETIYGYFRFFNSSTEAWRFNCASLTACNIDDMTSGSAVHRARFYAGSATDIDSEGSSAVTINNTTGSGTGGLFVYGGGSTKWFTVASLTAIQFPGLASTSQPSIPRLDTSGYITNSNIGLIVNAGTPGGGCTVPSVYFNTSGTNGGNNNYYICAAGTWLAVK